MIEKYFNGVIEQVYNRIGQVDKNIVMARYSNDFSLADLESVKRYSSESDSVFFTCSEFDYEDTVGAYEPFLDTICDMYRQLIHGDFSEFLKECEVYDLHHGVLETYYETGNCVRNEGVLLHEVKYEQKRMTKGIASMLQHIAKQMPIVIVINRFQLASRSAMELVKALQENPSRNIGIVLAVNEEPLKQESSILVWDEMIENLEDSSQIYHIGNSGKRRIENKKPIKMNQEYEEYKKAMEDLANTIALLDFEQASMYLRKLDRQIRFEDLKVEDEPKLYLYTSYAKVAILRGDIPKALEMITELSNLKLSGQEKKIEYLTAYYRSTCYMYQGKLSRAIKLAKRAKSIADTIGNEEQVFKAELLMVQAQMSGWYNIFFCVQDVEISDNLIERLMKYNYKNNLAHIYIYAYDNRPEMVARAYRSEAALFHFSKGINLAKEIGNEQLVYSAYQKNIMISSANGMYEIAMLYSVRTYQFMKEHKSLECGRIYSGIGYNLSALGDNKRASEYYSRAIRLFYELRLPEDIAEVHYNMGLNCIMEGNYLQAEHDLLLSMKAIEKLHLNSLRVCNLSKLYGLLALVKILQGDQFNCERYLLRCSQFLNYIIEKEKQENGIGIIHDYAKCDDDMFLYTFSKGLLHKFQGEKEEALVCYQKAEKFLANAEGNQFFIHPEFRRKRMELFQELGKTELYEHEKSTLMQHEELSRQAYEMLPLELLKEIEKDESGKDIEITESDLEALIKQEGTTRDLQVNRRQMEFISNWQKLIDITGVDVNEMVENALHVFLNHFNNDCALYIRYKNQEPKVLYNNTGIEMTTDFQNDIEDSMREYPSGFAVSKISGNYFEHMDLISYFGADEVCSFVAVPFFKNRSLKSVLITYVRMKDNWHSSIDRYMLNDDDLNIYQLLFREMSDKINRMEAYDKIFEMNQKLSQFAVTDMLTGIYNRAGMYQEIEHMVNDMSSDHKKREMGLMFIDLDNFKHYNDTFGHDIGDIILTSMAWIFSRAAEGKGFVSRYGGDEFIIILNTSDRQELEQIAKGIFSEIEAADGFTQDIEEKTGQKVFIDQNLRISCSIGIATSEMVETEEDINWLIRKADDRLYSVKLGQKGTYAFI